MSNKILKKIICENWQIEPEEDVDVYPDLAIVSLSPADLDKAGLVIDFMKNNNCKSVDFLGESSIQLLIGDADSSVGDLVVYSRHTVNEYGVYERESYSVFGDVDSYDKNIVIRASSNGELQMIVPVPYSMDMGKASYTTMFTVSFGNYANLCANSLDYGLSDPEPESVASAARSDLYTHIL